MQKLQDSEEGMRIRKGSGGGGVRDYMTTGKVRNPPKY
jgi:hypothetical protein